MSDAENKPAEESAQVEEMEDFEEEFEEEEIADGIEFEFIDERETETPIDFDRMERAVAKILADAGVERGRMEIVVLDADERQIFALFRPHRRRVFRRVVVVTDEVERAVNNV